MPESHDHTKKRNPTRIITTHDNADFDGLAAMLAASKLFPDAVPVLPNRLGRNVRDLLTLYQNGLPFVSWSDFRPRHVDGVILVDTQRVPDVRRLRSDASILVIDHHRQDDHLPDHAEFTGEEVGAATTLLIERLRTHDDIALTSLEATVMALGIYSDTGSLTYGTTTARDAAAIAWLLERGAVVDTVRRFLAPPLGDRQRDLLDMLMESVESCDIHGYAMAVCTASVPDYVENVNSVAHRIRELLDPAALFVLVQMRTRSKGEAVQMVLRSRLDAIDVGAIASEFGGGGHTRAAAAHVSHRSMQSLVDDLWRMLSERVKPVTRVADLMSLGVQTVDAGAKIGDVIQSLRRIGHEGYPVLDSGRVVGLLTRRDADRALEHGLRGSAIRDVMVGGPVTLTPDDSVSTLEQTMVQSDWGQIPVVDRAGDLIGIVTRTDLIKHWAKVHPAATVPEHTVDSQQITDVLGDPIHRLIEAVSHVARQQGHSMYIVGGVVRDLLLERPNYDIDFVLESDAIAYAESLCAQYGGKVNSYPPFGTATWFPDHAAAAAIGVSLDDIPDHVDFATARNEFYAHPTALPSVYHGSIKLDLHRRDFTINTLAVQVSPEATAGRLLDFYGGLDDLRDGQIRALHSLSFVDDPTRVLRAVRFEHRLGFSIESRTAELIDSSRPMLRRITGERVRNELKLVLKEDRPEEPLSWLQERGILEAIHPDFVFNPEAARDFQRAREQREAWPFQPERERHLLWALIMARIEPEKIPDLGERLLFRQSFIRHFVDAATLCRDPGPLIDPNATPSAIVRRLDGVGDLALLTAWVTCAALQHERIEQYISTWRQVRPIANGNTLKAMGLPPGPEYAHILSRLRDAWLDGDVSDEASERALLETLIKDIDDDRAG